MSQVVPAWVARITYAERFQVEPHLVNPPVRWWQRLNALDVARQQRRARETVERVGMAKANSATNKSYSDLMLALREKDAR